MEFPHSIRLPDPFLYFLPFSVQVYLLVFLSRLLSTYSWSYVCGQTDLFLLRRLTSIVQVCVARRVCITVLSYF